MTETGFPQLLHPTVDATNVREVANFYGDLLGLSHGAIPAGDEPQWVELMDSLGVVRLAVQRVESLTPTTWPAPDVPMQLHLEFIVSSREELLRHVERACALGSTVLMDRFNEESEQVFVLADPAGHPFCLLSRG
ncbi:VOC family protein [Dermacoccus abyssi]